MVGKNFQAPSGVCQGDNKLRQTGFTNKDILFDNNAPGKNVLPILSSPFSLLSIYQFLSVTLCLFVPLCVFVCLSYVICFILLSMTFMKNIRNWENAYLPLFSRKSLDFSIPNIPALIFKNNFLSALAIFQRDDGTPCRFLISGKTLGHSSSTQTQ